MAHTATAVDVPRSVHGQSSSGDAELAAELLGHTSSAITKRHYIEHGDAVNPVTAEFLESLVPKEAGDA